LGNLLSETSADRGTLSYTHDAAGNVLTITDARGITATYTYDALNRVTSTTYPNPAENLTLHYDTGTNCPFGTGRLCQVSDETGVTEYAYDAFGNATEHRKTELSITYTTGYAYDAADRITSMTYPDGRIVTYTRDAIGRITSVSTSVNGLPQSIVANRIYRADGLVTSQTFGNAVTETRSYDLQGRLTEQRLGSIDARSYAYDAKDNLLSVTDPRGIIIETNAYDLRNRLVARTDALGLSETFTYDLFGNRTARTDKKGQVTNYAYDALNRIARITYADGRTAEYSYDLAGNLTRISDSVSGECLFTYDNLNRLVSETSDRGVVSYSYDVLGRVIERTVNGGDATTYAYDRADRITTITFRTQSVTYSYDAAGRLTVRTLPNGIVQALVYNDANELLSITYHKIDGTVIDQVSYTYDANGNPIARNRQGLGSVPETPFTATYDANNRMLTFDGQPLTYDANGNLVSRQTPQGIITYTWDAQDRLIGITGPNGTASFKYDYAGRRIEKTINGTTTAFLYDGAQAIAELQGSAIGTTYLTGLQIDEVLARYSNQGNRTLLTDALGSVLAQTDETQTSTTLYAYSPYGEVTQVGENDNSLQYTGRENDDTGLYFYRVRYYDPALKRFLSSDPIGLEGGLNTYKYAKNNPLRWFDPTGLQSVLVCQADFGKLCVEKLRQQLQNRQPTRQLIFESCLICCSELLNSVPNPGGNITLLACIATCEAGLEGLRKKKGGTKQQ
jgi:RHS repeat-associated protein